MPEKTYIAIDLKSFYASVECTDRGLDPLTTNLVVADAARTEKTICLAVSPSLKAYGIPGRARLFEVVQKVKEANMRRLQDAPNRTFTGKSCFAPELAENPALELDYIVARPQMAHYMNASTRIYQVYLKYVAPEDIHVYSIDEVFIDATSYLRMYQLTAHDFAMKIIQDVLKTTGITATAGIGTNMYLCKIAMDIVAKHIPPDKDGVRIAQLDELSYREQLWAHRPLTDFWRIGRGIAKKLENAGLYTMGDVARCSIGKETDYYNEDLLYRIFGVNAELIIDHAWGYEPTTIADIKSYKPEANSISSGQVLQYPYPFEKARLVVREMAELLVLDLVDKSLVTDQIILTVGYDIENMREGSGYTGPTQTDPYGRTMPKSAHGTIRLGKHTSSTKQIVENTMTLFTRIVDPYLTVRRMYVVAGNVLKEEQVEADSACEQLNFFEDFGEGKKEKEAQKASEKKEKDLQHAMLDIKKKYGKNAILKGLNLEEGATARERNSQIGGHRA